MGNMMYRLDDVGDVHGVLNDFDMAIKYGRETGSTSNQRTGTLPYLALELIQVEDCVHRSRHDLESIMYCVMDMTMEEVWVPVGNGGVFKPALWKWRQLSLKFLDTEKMKFVRSNPGDFYKRYKPDFVKFLEVVMEWRFLFLQVYNHLSFVEARRDKEIDYETCGGIIDCQKFIDVLERYV